MATKTFTSAWVAIYRGRNGRYHSSNTPMRIGGFNDDISFIGVSQAFKDSLSSAVGTPTVKVRVYITDAGNDLNIGGHSQTYNKAGGSTPAIVNYGGSHSAPKGWKEITLPSSLVNDLKAGTKHGIVLYGGALYMLAHGKTGNSYQVTFSIDGNWNTPPSPPSSFVQPKASTVADTSVTVQWTDGSDAQTATASLRYEVGYYDGSKWAEYWTTSAGTKSHTYPLTSRPETSSARFAVRSIDTQGEKSAWIYSPYFAVNHNKPPSQPYNLVPKGGTRFDRTDLLRVSWKVNDDGNPAGYQVAWRTVSPTGALGSWVYYPSSTAYANTTRTHHDYAPNTFPLGEIEWTVRTKDQQGESSPWSNRERLFAGEASTAPIFGVPNTLGTVNQSNLTARWSSLDQQRYEIELVQGGLVKWSESAISGAKATLIGFPLTNDTTYTLRLRIMSFTNGLWSEWAEITFTTAFTPPKAPVLSITTTNAEGASLDTIFLEWTTEVLAIYPAPTFIEVYRREFNVMVAQPWVQIVDEQTINGSLIDYSVASDTTYEYMVRVWAVNETFADSNIVEGTLHLERSFLHRASQPSDLIVIDAESRDEVIEFDGAFMKFAGRPKRVYESSEYEERSIPLAFSVETPIELRQTVNFLKRREVMLYRDTVGRRLYGIVRNVRIIDKPVSGFELSLTIEEVDYTEGEVLE